jgi:hypothetical protein
MNERIQELAEQAGIVFWEMSGDVDWRQANKETLEKFAELIVRECMDIAYAYDAPKMSGPGMIVANRIEDHFGVEE